MFRARYFLPAMLILSAVILGCTKPQSASSLAPAPTVDKSLEAKIARLEADLKKANEDIAKLSAQQRLDQSKLGLVEKERDSLKLSLKDRTSERDIAANKLETFRKNVKDLLGQMEAATAQPFKPMPESITVLPPPVVPGVVSVQ